MDERIPRHKPAGGVWSGTGVGYMDRRRAAGSEKKEGRNGLPHWRVDAKDKTMRSNKEGLSV